VPTYRDATGKRLTDYPRPSVAVDAALLTIVPEREIGQLAVLEVRRTEGTGWALPGTFLREHERLIDAVQRALRTKTGVDGLRPRQLGVFDDPKRDDRGWVLSVAHADVVPAERLAARHPERTRLMPVERAGRLPYDHGEIIRRAVADVRRRYAERPDPDRLLPESFTLRELRLVHEGVAGHPLQRDSFRRAMEAFLEPTGETVVRGPGRPAELFRLSERTEP
jgi:ADP-ribose pyrophosphatase YjhB (NUDIX family)